jgi:Cys-Gly metallodipeptidase DUG1
MPHLDPFFKQVDTLQDTFIARLGEAVGIPSISSEDARRPDVVRVCGGWTGRGSNS